MLSIFVIQMSNFAYFLGNMVRMSYGTVAQYVANGLTWNVVAMIQLTIIFVIFVKKVIGKNEAIHNFNCFCNLYFIIVHYIDIVWIV